MVRRQNSCSHNLYEIKLFYKDFFIFFKKASFKLFYKDKKKLHSFYVVSKMVIKKQPFGIKK